MARGKGFQAITAVKKATTWGTPVACGAGNGLGLTSLDTPGNTALVDNMQINGTVQPGPKYAGNTAVNVVLKTHLRYEGYEMLLAMVMGATGGAPTTVDTSARQHKLKVLTDLDGLFTTLAYEIVKDTTVVEIPAVKWSGFTIRGKSGQPIELELRGIGDAYNYGTSAVNTTTTIDTTTISANGEIALFKHAKVLLNAQTGADFTDTLAGDQLPVVGFEISVDRPMEAVFSTARAGLSTEPRYTGWLIVKGSFDYPDLDSTSTKNSPLAADQITLTPKKCKIVLTGQTLAGSATQYFQYNFWLPYVQLAEGKPGIPGPEGETWSQSWESKAVGTIPTGFTATYTDSLTIDIFSKLATDPLA